MQNELVQVKKGEIFTTSNIIAEKLEVPHRDLLKTIEKLLINLGATKSYLNFSKKFIKSKYKHWKTKVEYDNYLINEPAFTILVMQLWKYKNALKIQEQFVEQFFKMKQVLQNQSNASWIEKREQGKLTRRQETDVIKEFVEYATKQWSKSAKLYYMNITKMTNKALELLIQVKWWTPVRDLATISQFWIISSLDDRAMNTIKEWMDQKLPYRFIYQYAKDEVNKLAHALDFKPVKQLWS